MVAPILVYVAATVGATLAGGVRIALWVCLGLYGGGTLFAISLYLLGGVRPPAPALLRRFGGDTAWDSPPLLAAVRHHSGDVEPQ